MSITDLYNSFPDVHPNIIIKTDILRQGIDISQASINNFSQRDDLLWKGFHLFSYDRQETKVYGDKIPWYIRLEDGCPIMVRTNTYSPYLLDWIDGEFVILEKKSNDIVTRKLWFERCWLPVCKITLCLLTASLIALPSPMVKDKGFWQ